MQGGVTPGFADRLPTAHPLVLFIAICSYIRPMRAVGIRELKNRLSEFVRLVEAGESVLVTDHGRVVAELSPPGRTTLPSPPPTGAAALVARGEATSGAPHDPALYTPLPRLLADGTAEALLAEERTEG